MTNHFLGAAKAYAALAGGVAEALLGVLGPDGVEGTVLKCVVAVAGAVAVYVVPNKSA